MIYIEARRLPSVSPFSESSVMNGLRIGTVSSTMGFWSEAYNSLGRELKHFTDGLSVHSKLGSPSPFELTLTERLDD